MKKAAETEIARLNAMVAKLVERNSPGTDYVQPPDDPKIVTDKTFAPGDFTDGDDTSQVTDHDALVGGGSSGGATAGPR